jgi:hypothetical protein
MPTFLNFFTATVYCQQANFDGKQGGWQFPSFYLSPSYRAFPKSGYNFYAISPAQTITNQGVAVTVNTIIEQIPSGVLGGFTPVRYATDSTFVQLYNQGA